MILLSWFLLLILTLAAYVAPGYLFLLCFKFPDLNRLSRILLSVPVSLVIVPFVMSALAGTWRYQPQLWHLAVIAGAGGLVALLLARTGKRPSLRFT